MTIAARYEEVLAEVATSCQQSGRSPDEVTIIGVTKAFPAETVIEAAKGGISQIGESRVQELVAKATGLSGLDVSWHMIGHLQSNKVRSVLPWVSLIHSVDRPSLAAEISRRASEPVRVLLQVNTTVEPSKFGVEPEGLEPLVAAICGLDQIEVQGLMTIGPRDGTERENRRAFALLRDLRDQCQQQFPELKWGALSMGMSSDFGLAILEGATHVRVGSRIFGPRPTPARAEVAGR